MSFELEDVERGELESMHAVASVQDRDALRLSCEVIGSALVSIAGGLPASAIVLNRAIGLGLGRPADPETIDAIVARYAAAGVSRYFVHLHPESVPAATRSWLESCGLERARSWMKFTRGREAPPTVDTSVEVRVARPEDMPAFARIASAAFDLGPAAAPWLCKLDRAQDWRAYVGLVDGEVVATGGLFVRNGVGWLDFGATDPRFRGRGAQSALLRQRIVDALDLGCGLLATATGEAVPGDPQHSYSNIRKMGFNEAYLRENYAPRRVQ